MGSRDSLWERPALSSGSRGKQMHAREAWGVAGVGGRGDHEICHSRLRGEVACAFAILAIQDKPLLAMHLGRCVGLESVAGHAFACPASATHFLDLWHGQIWHRQNSPLLRARHSAFPAKEVLEA